MAGGEAQQRRGPFQMSESTQYYYFYSIPGRGGRRTLLLAEAETKMEVGENIKNFDGYRLTSVTGVFFFEMFVSEYQDIDKYVLASDASTDFLPLFIWNRVLLYFIFLVVTNFFGQISLVLIKARKIDLIYS